MILHFLHGHCPPQVSYLVVYGSLPNTRQLQRWTEAVMRHSGAAQLAVRAAAG